MGKQTFTREEVIAIIGDLLERPDFLIEAMVNENTDTDAERCLEVAEETLINQ